MTTPTDDEVEFALRIAALRAALRRAAVALAWDHPGNDPACPKRAIVREAADVLHVEIETLRPGGK